MKKKAAIELSMTTIVVVVLSLALLIMGFVLVRSIMCGAIGLTEEINEKVKSQINSLFGSTAGGEVTCLGAGEPITMIAGQGNWIICGVRAEEEANYEFKVTVDPSSDIPPATVNQWITNHQKTVLVGPNDREPIKKIVKLNVPKTAPEKDIELNLEVRRAGDLIWQQTLSYRIEQAGAIKGFLC